MPEYYVNLVGSDMRREQGGRVVAYSRSQNAEAWAWRNQIFELTTSLKSALDTHNYNDFNDKFKTVDLRCEVSKVFVQDQVDTAISEWRESGLLLQNSQDVGVSQFLSNIQGLGLTDFEFDGQYTEIGPSEIEAANEAAAIQARDAATRRAQEAARRAQEAARLQREINPYGMPLAGQGQPSATISALPPGISETRL